jgi:hypothetical protein
MGRDRGGRKYKSILVAIDHNKVSGMTRIVRLVNVG